jgi:signal transduction histidine kinase
MLMTFHAPPNISAFSVHRLSRYLVAAWSVAVAFLLTLLLSPFVPPGVSPLFLAAVMLSAWRGGLGPGLVATILSAVASAFFFLPPTWSLEINFDDFLQLGVFTLAAVIISSLSVARERVEAELAAALKREQAARREAEEANELKDEFIAAVSHELRTPLTTIKTLTHVLLQGGQPESENREYLQDISSECDRQIDLVLNLLDLSRITAGTFQLMPQPVNVGEVLRECLKIERFAAEERNHSLAAELPQNLPRAFADQSALRRTLCGLVENAMKYTPEGGAILLKAHANGDELAISIADTGRGIPDEDLPHVFEKFYRGRGVSVEPRWDSSQASATGDIVESLQESHPEEPGLGLGLYLARNIIEQLGGRICVESRIEQGSTFTVYLPVWRD